MGSKSNDKQLRERIENAAKQVAIEFWLPRRLSDLRKYGWHGVSWAKAKYDQSLGLPFPQYAWRYICDATWHGGKLVRAEEDAEGVKRTPPSEGRIRDALETFSKKQWIPLIAEFGRKDLDPLRDYLDVNRDELEQSPDWEKKYEGVLAHATKRNIVLMLSAPNLHR